MESNEEIRPLIIKRKKVIVGGGHHGGAWKVAYADFVTAMMAFFMLMWLLNATTEKQRKGLADYFSPTIPITRVSGGGDGMFQGDSMFSENILSQNGLGGTTQSSDSGQQVVNTDEQAAASAAAEERALEDVIEGLVGRGGDSLLEELALEHVQTRLSDEGLVIELFALEGRPLFVDGAPTEVTQVLAQMIAESAEVVTNAVAVEGHVESAPIVVAENRTWETSSERAHIMRGLLVAEGMAEDRFRRITGHGDRDHAERAAFDVRNNRLEVILLRSDR